MDTKLLNRLKEKSDYYPKVMRVTFDENGWPHTYLSTLVRVYREKWYYVHLVQEAVDYGDHSDRWMIYNNLHIEAYKIVNLYKISGFEDVDPCQMPEPERLAREVSIFRI